jgi:hypothetical protein
MVHFCVYEWLFELENGKAIYNSSSIPIMVHFGLYGSLFELGTQNQVGRSFEFLIHFGMYGYLIKSKPNCRSTIHMSILNNFIRMQMGGNPKTFFQI